MKLIVQNASGTQGTEEIRDPSPPTRQFGVNVNECIAGIVLGLIGMGCRGKEGGGFVWIR